MVDAYEGPQVAVSEFAAMKGGETLAAAIAEAAFMCALERNCDKVRISRFPPTRFRAVGVSNLEGTRVIPPSGIMDSGTHAPS